MRGPMLKARCVWSNRGRTTFRGHRAYAGYAGIFPSTEAVSCVRIGNFCRTKILRVTKASRRGMAWGTGIGECFRLRSGEKILETARRKPPSPAACCPARITASTKRGGYHDDLFVAAQPAAGGRLYRRVRLCGGRAAAGHSGRGARRRPPSAGFAADRSSRRRSRRQAGAGRPPPLPTAPDKLPLAKLKVPAGFNIEVYAAGMPNARSLR